MQTLWNFQSSNSRFQWKFEGWSIAKFHIRLHFHFKTSKSSCIATKTSDQNALEIILVHFPMVSVDFRGFYTKSLSFTCYKIFGLSANIPALVKEKNKVTFQVFSGFSTVWGCRKLSLVVWRVLGSRVGKFKIFQTEIQK